MQSKMQKHKKISLRCFCSKLLSGFGVKLGEGKRSKLNIYLDVTTAWRDEGTAESRGCRDTEQLLQLHCAHRD